MTATSRALLLLVVSATLFGAMAVAAKLAAVAGLSGPQLAMLRFLVCLVPFLAPRLAREALRAQRLDLLAYRGVFGGVAVLLYFLAIEHITAGIATLLNYTSPIWSGLFARLFLGERLQRATFVPLVVALAGVYVVATANAPLGAGFPVGRWEAVGLLSAILSGGAVTAIRAARRTEGTWSIFASFTVCGLLASAPFSFPLPRVAAPAWVLALLVGVLSFGAQMLMTHAYRWVDNVRAGVIAQLGVVVALALGAVLLDEQVAPRQLVGAALTLAGVVGVTVTARPPRPQA